MSILGACFLPMPQIVVVQQLDCDGLVSVTLRNQESDVEVGDISHSDTAQGAFHPLRPVNSSKPTLLTSFYKELSP